MGDFYDVFISYGRADSKAFVVQLVQQLTDAGHRVWCDFNDIPLGVDFQNQIDSGIEKAHNFVFVIAPHAVNSAYCAKEIELACRYQKRIIPILHVEQISRDTWLQRNPNGTEAQWQDYQAKGLHSSFANMHPGISKINWVYMRENDDVATALADVGHIVQRHRDYVEQHTRLLARALAWQRQQQQTEFLLLGETRQAAETWLKRRFGESQSPCEPTDLHCEFITESIKNAHNNMTQVFLAYAQADAAVMHTIRHSLQRQALTVWTNQTDIATGDAFKRAVARGIEEADTLVYLLSPDSLKSQYCQQELDYAIALNKRIVPVLVRPLPGAVPHGPLGELQYIDLTDNVAPADYGSDESALIKALKQDAVYYDQHKTLLTKALKWKRQQHNPSILLRGYDLRQGEAWLKTALGRPAHGATQYHQAFIQASIKHPPPPSIDVFISYSSADGDIARMVNNALQSQGKTTWFDQESIAAGTANFQQEIYRGIEISDNFLFILSPRSVKSPYCKQEVEHAARFNKRLVTLLHHPIDTADLHPELAKVQWLDFSQRRGNFTTHFNQLVRILDTDRDHVQSHTKWLQRSLEWQQKDQSQDLLLRGAESAIATQWLHTTHTQQKRPAVTPEQRAFITASQTALDAEARRDKQRVRVLQSLLATMSVLAAIAVVAGGFAFRQSSRLNLDQTAERVSRSLAVKPVEGLIQTLALVGKSRSQLWNIRPSVRSALRNAIGTITERNRLTGHDAAVWSAVYGPDGQLIASGGFDHVVRLWDAQGNPVGSPFQGHTDDIWSVAFSPDGQTLASASSDGTVRLWDLEGNNLGVFLTERDSHVKTVAFSPDGAWIASGDQGGAVRLWNRQGKLVTPPFQTDGTVWSVAFSPDGKQIISGGENGLVYIWTAQGKRVNTLEGHQGGILAVAVSPDGQLIASGGTDQTIRLWNRQGKLLHQIEGHSDTVVSLAFSPDGQWLISGADDNTVRVWDRAGQPVGPTLIGHEYYVYSVAFSPDGETIISSGEDETIRLWSLRDVLQRRATEVHRGPVNAMASNGQSLVTAGDDGTIKLLGSDVDPFVGHGGAVLAVDISQDGRTIVSGGADKTVRFWNGQGQTLATGDAHTDRVNAVAIHPTQRLVASASDDKTLRLWDFDGNSVAKADHGDGVNAVVFSPDGTRLVSGGDDRTLRFWDLQGTPMGDPIEGHRDNINALAFSPDGEYIVSASRDRTLRLWTGDGEPVGTSFNGHQSDVVAVTFSPDGEYIVSASRDQTLRLWDLQGNPIGEPLTGHNATASTVLFSGDGQWILSANSDGFLRRWEGGSLAEWVTWGCDRIRNHSAAAGEKTAKACGF
ncbi:toll/interleukin-1 receptor domain-containing protein [Leptothoe kymatousa]|uniref:TIR domain-containing protein n=1 Tax=Leptothoe kymatousa TAU-MAC 1615 TaxID=2364775 RepID=A0ABS5Y4I6_9CYAN|nr:TIR domain-containing protein [Leptothoe kymatousa]MBT9312740.1 TIR domain-containing protein [Leptothoe kymatousa TAU-MAC 1615]